jgi:hypothetical protein
MIPRAMQSSSWKNVTIVVQSSHDDKKQAGILRAMLSTRWIKNAAFAMQSSRDDKER